MLTDPRLAHVSSSLVKEVATLGGPVTEFLPPVVHEQLLAKLSAR
jgi:pantetheine-phosphate adenylyltransferase